MFAAQGWVVEDPDEEGMEAEMVVDRTPETRVKAAGQPENGRLVLTEQEFVGLCQIVAAPESTTPNGRAAFARYRRMKAQG